MSNQRSGNWKPATLRDNDTFTSMELCQFVKSAKELLEAKGEEDSAFYFEQIEDWLRTNPGKGLKNAGMILGL